MRSKMPKKDYLQEIDENAVSKDIKKISIIISLIVLTAITVILYGYFKLSSTDNTPSKTEMADEVKRKTSAEHLDSILKERQKTALPEKYDEDEKRIVVTDEMLYEAATKRKDDVSVVKYTITKDLQLQTVVESVAKLLNGLTIPFYKSENAQSILFSTDYHLGFNKIPSKVVDFKIIVEISKTTPKNLKMLYYYHPTENKSGLELKNSYEYFNNSVVSSIKGGF